MAEVLLIESVLFYFCRNNSLCHLLTYFHWIPNSLNYESLHKAVWILRMLDEAALQNVIMTELSAEPELVETIANWLFLKGIWSY